MSYIIKKSSKLCLKITSSILIIISAAGLAFPPISDTITRNQNNHRIEQFETKTENIVDLGNNITHDEALKENKIDRDGYLLNENSERISDYPVIIKADLDKLYKDSKAYNEQLKANQKNLLTTSDSYQNSALDLSSYGILDGLYGYISAPSIDMNLPIYLGANEYSMSMGAAHLCYTSLPIGGKNTNCVLSGHTGYIGHTFFDYIPNLKIGDTVSLTNYWNTMNYKVIKTFTRKDNEVNEIFIEESKDLLSMLTCYYEDGIKKRYYVVCERS